MKISEERWSKNAILTYTKYLFSKLFVENQLSKHKLQIMKNWFQIKTREQSPNLLDHHFIDRKKYKATVLFLKLNYLISFLHYTFSITETPLSVFSLFSPIIPKSDYKSRSENCTKQCGQLALFETNSR